MGDLLTDCSRSAMRIAHDEAERWNHEFVDAEHILLGILRAECGVAWEVLTTSRCASGKNLLGAIESELARRPAVSFEGRRHLTVEVKRCVEQGMIEAGTMGDALIDTEHILLGLLHSPTGVAATLIEKAGIDSALVRIEVLESSRVRRQAIAPPAKR